MSTYIGTQENGNKERITGTKYYIGNWVNRGTDGNASSVNMALVAKVELVDENVKITLGVQLDTGSMSATTSKVTINGKEYTYSCKISESDREMIANSNYPNDYIVDTNGYVVSETITMPKNETRTFTASYKRSAYGNGASTITLYIENYSVGAPTNVQLINQGNNTYRITATPGAHGEGVHCYYSYMDNTHTDYIGANIDGRYADGATASGGIIPIYKGVQKVCVRSATIADRDGENAGWDYSNTFNVVFNDTEPTILLSQPKKSKNIEISYNDQNRADINETELLVSNTTKNSVIFQSNSVASSYSAVISPSDSDGLKNSKNKDNIRGSMGYTYKEYSYNSNEKKLIPETKTNTIFSNLIYQASPIYVRTQNGFENGTAYILKNGQWVESSDVIVKI
jgi:hypothetical protein